MLCIAYLFKNTLSMNLKSISYLSMTYSEQEEQVNGKKGRCYVSGRRYGERAIVACREKTGA